MNPTFRTILVATDFTSASDLAIDYGRTLADRLGAALHLVHVIEEPLPTGAEVYVVDIPGLRERLVDEARERLRGMAADIGGLTVTSEVVLGKPAQRITEAAVAGHADLIVLGTHSRGVLAQRLVGSVAERVVRTAHCPVLTIRETPVPSEPATGARSGTAERA